MEAVTILGVIMAKKTLKELQQELVDLEVLERETRDAKNDIKGLIILKKDENHRAEMTQRRVADREARKAAQEADRAAMEETLAQQKTDRDAAAVERGVETKATIEAARAVAAAAADPSNWK